MRYTLTLQEHHLTELKQLVLKPDGYERPAILMCGFSEASNDIWDGGSEMRFLSKEIIPIPDNQINSHTSAMVNWDTAIFRKAMKRAKENNLRICLVHSHPEGHEQFSEIDDKHEKELFEMIYSRNGGILPNLSLIITCSGVLTARACTSNLVYHQIDFIRVMGSRYNFYYKGKYTVIAKEEFSRQQLAFGPSLNADLSKLRIAVVGNGATGSATAHLLARLGVGQILLVDKDLVERSNLSRLHGATSSDADLGKSKAAVLAKFLANIGIGCRIRKIEEWVVNAQVRDALKTCDIIFSCTDDNSGRILMNRFAHFFLVPVIDMGIVIDPAKDRKEQLETLQGRVTIVQPGNTCLLCRNIVNRQLAREEDLKRNDPVGYLRQKEEAYVIGENNPSPAVITFTSEVATMAVNELINRLTGFKTNGVEKHIIRFFDKGIDRRPHISPDEDCPICGSDEYWGRGDMTPFLDQIN
ncbi:ThiF family adenylyltransferase [Mucilaginibacter sp. BJC16-A38]|uniref:ThiF family adenylyltransferase n=1 Tax=Mucilaginibacter phenanthrenivorans TaxID=1234842 RepID=UPI0021576753|nr:ThiF family adenylyltransferase [Mucilaginibacter phenanthrenivorans]MCR8560880.1 ThiF family adenylyltransferase [Mucilaginibacter phenanthrenivorans]